MYFNRFRNLLVLRSERKLSFYDLIIKTHWNSHESYFYHHILFKIKPLEQLIFCLKFVLFFVTLYLFSLLIIYFFAVNN